MEILDREEVGISLEEKKNMEILKERKWKFLKREKKEISKEEKMAFSKGRNGNFDRKWQIPMRENRKFQWGEN